MQTAVRGWPVLLFFCALTVYVVMAGVPWVRTVLDEKSLMILSSLSKFCDFFTISPVEIEKNHARGVP